MGRRDVSVQQDDEVPFIANAEGKLTVKDVSAALLRALDRDIAHDAIPSEGPKWIDPVAKRFAVKVPLRVHHST